MTPFFASNTLQPIRVQLMTQLKLLLLHLAECPPAPSVCLSVAQADTHHTSPGPRQSPEKGEGVNIHGSPAPPVTPVIAHTWHSRPAAPARPQSHSAAALGVVGRGLSARAHTHTNLPSCSMSPNASPHEGCCRTPDISADLQEAFS